MDNKKACEKLMSSLDVDHEKYKFGHTMIFFRAGFLGVLEDLRDARLSAILSGLQARGKGRIMRVEFNKLVDRREALRNRVEICEPKFRFILEEVSIFE